MMKRMTAIILSLLILSGLLAACGDADDTAPTDAGTVSDVTEINPGDFYSFDDDETEAPTLEDVTERASEAPELDADLGYVMDRICDEFDFGEFRTVTDPERYYSISARDISQFYALKPIESGDYCEIVLSEAISADAASRVEARLNRHLDSLYNSAASYDKDALGLIEACEVVRNGRYVYLVISPDYDAICALIDSEIN